MNIPINNQKWEDPPPKVEELDNLIKSKSMTFLPFSNEFDLLIIKKRPTDFSPVSIKHKN